MRVPGTHYAFYVHGPDEPEKGNRFDPNIALLDPFSRELSFTTPAALEGGRRVFDWGSDRSPATPWRDTLIYELHTKGFTQLHSDVPEAWRGKYLGLTAPPYSST